jgi:hypothetical protein
MNDSSRATTPSGDSLSLFALAAGLAMGHVVVAMAEQTTLSRATFASAVVFVVFGAAAVLCALASVPRPRWVAPRFARWITAIGAGLLGSLAPALLF